MLEWLKDQITMPIGSSDSHCALRAMSLDL